MKKCSYCGRENPDEATQCRECGTQEFDVVALPIIPAQESSKKRGRLFPQGHLPLRFLIAGCVWLVVSGLSIYVAWQNARESEMAWFEQWWTQSELKDINRLITQYQQKSNSVPRSLDQLRSVATESDVQFDIQFNSDGKIEDGWKRPFLFSSDGTNYLVTTYGRDGKLGGIWLDCDLTSKNPKPKESLPTFGQFLDNVRVRGMIESCIVCGGLAFFLCFFTIEIPELTRRGLVFLGLKLGATIIGTFIVTSFITALHIPSGH